MGESNHSERCTSYGRGGAGNLRTRSEVVEARRQLAMIMPTVASKTNPSHSTSRTPSPSSSPPTSKTPSLHNDHDTHYPTRSRSSTLFSAGSSILSSSPKNKSSIMTARSRTSSVLKNVKDGILCRLGSAGSRAGSRAGSPEREAVGEGERIEDWGLKVQERKSKTVFGEGSAFKDMET